MTNRNTKPAATNGELTPKPATNTPERAEPIRLPAI